MPCLCEDVCGETGEREGRLDYLLTLIKLFKYWDVPLYKGLLFSVLFWGYVFKFVGLKQKGGQNK